MICGSLATSLLAILAVAAPLWATAAVPDLGVYNFASEIQAHVWTCVLFYDRNDALHRSELFTLMESLNEIFQDNDRVGFALLDIRANPTYRAQYKYENDPHPFLFNFYTEFPDIVGGDVMHLSSTTFMNLQGDLYWPSRLSLFAHDYNVYGELDLDFPSEVDAKVGILTYWINSTVHKESDSMEILMPSQLQKERDLAEEADDLDNSFTFKRHFALKAEREEESGDDSDDEAEDGQEKSTRFLLESGADSLTKVLDRNDYYKYELMTVNDADNTAEFLQMLGMKISKYLVWVVGYEVIWDEQRKAREDQQTNYGYYLREMDDKIKALLEKIFDDPHYKPPPRDFDGTKYHLGDTEEEKRETLQRREAVPHALKRYLDEMVFGYARSPASMKEYLDHVSDTLGPTPEARRQARKAAPKFNMFERMKDYMRIVEDVAKEEDLYLNVVADLTSQWHNILVEFQESINQHYVKEYLSKHPLENGYNFTRYAMDVIDMEDPANAGILSSYDEFNKKYTLPAVPVILGNVNMTDEVYTLDYLVDQCGAMDVTSKIRISNPVGKKSTDGWGGLNVFVLEDDLVNPQRVSTVHDEYGEEVDIVDRTINLRQFVTLSAKLGDLYLHDMSLPDDCDTILYEDTLYGGHTKYRIPSVVAAYDLFHRATLYNYARSWPSLFVGKKGSNSKVHVDSGASGFFMYLVSGRKRWMVYHPSERPFLYDRISAHSFIPDVLGMDKSEEANEYLSKRFPLLHRAEKAYEIIQEPGQLIYIPPDSPHAVENLEDIVGIALNLAPRDALASHVHDQIHNDRNFGYTELALKYWLFEDNARQPMETKDPLYMTFAEYRAQF